MKKAPTLEAVDKSAIEGVSEVKAKAVDESVN